MALAAPVNRYQLETGQMKVLNSAITQQSGRGKSIMAPVQVFMVADSESTPV